jgi:hypothetical protein
LHWRQDSNEPRKPVERLETQRGADTSGSVVISVQVALDESKAAALASALSKPGLDQGGLRAAVFTGWEIGFHTEVYQPGGKAALTALIREMIDAVPPSLGPPRLQSGGAARAQRLR